MKRGRSQYVGEASGDIESRESLGCVNGDTETPLGHASWILKHETDLYESQDQQPENCLAGASHIYLSVAGIASQSRDSGACTRKECLPAAAEPVGRWFFSFFTVPRFHGCLGTAVEPAEHPRDRTLEEAGVGVRAEVTPAPRRSRGRAPVRSDAFLSHPPLLAALCLRYVIFLTRSFLIPRRPFGH
ncbi:hypothetical protein KM043_009600 [Ampulex compressa]|nr:hypothetical protein KM043_009600 [Ampulex compressa]